MNSSTSNELGKRIGRGLAWSSISSVVLRLGNFALGILLARLLAPEQFGVFAVALTVQAVLLSLADLGMSADLIRSDNPKAKAPTVATLAALTGITLTVTLALSAQGLADLLGSPDAGAVIALMSLSLVLASLGVVPYAALQRQFAQKQVFGIACVEFVAGTGLTIALVLGGWGVMGLAIGRIAAQSVTLVLQFIVAREKVRFGFDMALAPSILRFGIPVAGANALSWALLNVDNVAISRLIGPVALGFYYLAFNISNWPMSAIGQVVRSVSMPAFARLAKGASDTSFSMVVGPVWAASLLVGLMLATLASPVVEILYGSKWLPAAAVLGWLGLFGALRTLFDLSASYLLARGATKSTLFVQVAWLIALLPAIAAGAYLGQISGVAIAHLATALVVVTPAYALSLRSAGADLRTTARRLWPPAAAAVPATAVVLGALALMPTPLSGLLVGAIAGTSLYALILAKWFLRQIRGAADLFHHSDTRPTSGTTDIPLSPTAGGST